MSVLTSENFHRFMHMLLENFRNLYTGKRVGADIFICNDYGSVNCPSIITENIRLFDYHHILTTVAMFSYVIG